MPSIAIVDLGGQYCHLISRRLRDLSIQSEVIEPNVPAHELSRYAGVILSGGPTSVYDENSLTVDRELFALGVPVLGICYGHQLLAKSLGATVERGSSEYGLTRLAVAEANWLFDGTPGQQDVWMSHSDSVKILPKGLTVLARTVRCEIAAFADFDRKLYGVQFHPEVAHTEYGTPVLENFAKRICEVKERAAVADRVAGLVHQVRVKVGSKSVFFLVSGGVDSTVAFGLCAKALPRERVLGVYVDTGLMRENETAELRRAIDALGLGDRLKIRNESERFLKALDGITDPEQKRHIIGRLFVDVQSEAMVEYGIDSEEWLIGQGTIYPDTIESGGRTGRTAVIKTHHNRCKEIVDLLSMGRVVEPLTEFYKDEVRRIGVEIGLDQRLTNRWPFPGPGLAIRCLCSGANTEERARPIQLPRECAAYEAVRLPLRSVGVQGDGRTYREVVALLGPMCKESDYESLQNLSAELCNVGMAHNRVIVHVAGNVGRLEEARIMPTKMARERIEMLRAADFVARTSMEKSGLADEVWQFPVVLIPMRFNKGETIVLRPVNSEDGMTANFARLPLDVLHQIGKEVVSIGGIDAVFLDITDKPPATIEWE